MCGIAGIVGDTSACANLAAMLTRLEHRGPDGGGSWHGDGIALGHSRLEVRGLGPSGAQPSVSSDGSLVVVYNGELYNFHELRLALEKRGHHFTTTCDTEVVVAALQEYGSDAIAMLEGMFALAAWDRHTRTLTIARDRFGEKPVYYAGHGNRFAFASELAALEPLRWDTGGLDRAAVALLLARRCIPAPWTIYRNFRKLPAGSILQWRNGHASIETYWRPVDALAESLRQPRIRDLETPEATLLAAVGRQLVADVPVGVFLSGGIDSSLVAALACSALGTSVTGVTLGWADQDLDETSIARTTAKALGMDHLVVQLRDSDVADLVLRTSQAFGEPFADPTAVPLAVLSEAAAQDLTVCLTGDGGDECFGGYSRYRRLERLAPAASRAGALRPLAERLQTQMRVPSARYLGRSVGDIYSLASASYDPAEAAALAGVELPTYPSLNAFSLAGAGPRRAAMATDLAAYLPDQLLTKTDRASMQHSLEARAPLLDTQVVQMSFRLDQRMIRDKLALRQIVSKYLPHLAQQVPKRGFEPPTERWLRGPLRELVSDAVREDVLINRGIEHPEVALEIVRRQRAGEPLSNIVWPLLMLSLWSPSTPR